MIRFSYYPDISLRFIDRMRTNTAWENNNISVSLAVSKILSIFTSTRPCRELHTNVRSSPHERAQLSTRACGGLDTSVWRQINYRELKLA